MQHLWSSLSSVLSKKTIKLLDQYVEQDIIFQCTKHGEIRERICLKQGQPAYCPVCNKEEKKRKEQHEMLALRIKSAHIPLRYHQCKLSDIEVETDKEATNMRHIFTWMSHFKQNEGQISGFLMTGNVGSGKTHIACAMGRAVLTMGASFRYMTHEAINNRLRATWNKYTALTQEEVIKSLSTVHLLAIDELAECNSLELRKALSSLIDQRYNAERPTILISNKRMDAIKSILGDRIYSRNCNGILEFDGRDRRIDDNPFMM
jgi:DNA replication protein DnaC